ncbi:hypothetical protein EYC84_004145 [Monilinia fructicola]|uniref:Uncharacterized protein n=1 Tax=Monilinia fructicola TaxID=38448 RepID=A0A5M9K258_MONFR|nr:hypothetical protein EYC84_004145 [Monilinia fructicola]
MCFTQYSNFIPLILRQLRRVLFLYFLHFSWSQVSFIMHSIACASPRRLNIIFPYCSCCLNSAFLSTTTTATIHFPLVRCTIFVFACLYGVLSFQVALWFWRWVGRDGVLL